jgi:hypothetical protein
MEHMIQDTPQNSYEQGADNQYASYTIEPCAMMVRDHSDPRPSMFHLLQCGHIVAVDGEDTRCGITCQEGTNIAQPSTLYDISIESTVPLNC